MNSIDDVKPVGKFAKFTDGIWREVTAGYAGVPLYEHQPAADVQPVAWTAKQAIGNAPATEQACEVVIEAEFLPPSSWSAKKRQRASEGMEHHLVSPDADNIAKAVLDGLNGTVWVDDKQVVCLTVKKRYGTSDRTNVSIRLLGVNEVTA